MKPRTAALPFILITVLLDMLGIGFIIPVLPKLVTSMTGQGISEGSNVYGWFVASYALMQFLFSPFLGVLSDTLGRRPVILFSLLGAGIDYLLMAFAPNLEWLFLGRVISGITGANITAANAYIADVSPPEERARNFGMLGACFGIGFILGPATGGLLGQYGLRLPFVAAAIMTLCNALYGAFVLPESLPPERRAPFKWNRTNPLASIGSLRLYPAVFGLTITFALERLAHDVFPSTWVLYVTYRFQWTELEIGISLAIVGVIFAVVQGGLTGRIVGYWGERKSLIIGLATNSLACLAFGLATEGWMFYAIIVASGISGVAGPSMQALITKRVPETEHGAVQGALSSINGVMTIFGPLLATHLFGYFTSDAAPLHIPGAAFFASSILVAAATLVAVVTTRSTSTR